MSARVAAPPAAAPRRSPPPRGAACRASPAAAGLAAGAGLAAYAGVDRAAAARRARARARAAALARAARRAARRACMSDLHAGVPHAGLDAIRRAVDALNAREPDVHLLLGDYLDASQVLAARRSRPSASPTSSRGCASPLGTVAVIGNHDWRNSGDRMWRALEAVGITVLEDRAVELHAPGGRSGSPGWPTCATAGPTSARALRDVPARRAGDRALARPGPVPGRARPRSRSRSPATRTAARSRSRSCAAR